MTPATLYHAPAIDLDEHERIAQADLLRRFVEWCGRMGRTPVLREMPADPDEHAERRQNERR